MQKGWARKHPEYIRYLIQAVLPPRYGRVDCRCLALDGAGKYVVRFRDDGGYMAECWQAGWREERQLTPPTAAAVAVTLEETRA